MPDLTDISTSATQEVIQVNYDIHTLMNKAEGTITEDEFLAILKRYSLRQGLIAIGQVSSALFSSKSENKISQGGYRDPVTGAFVTQFSLAYLANALLVSGANDYKYKKLITQRKNFIALNNIYSNGYTTKIFSSRTFSDFMSYLDSIETNADPKHLQYVADAYGETKPYMNILWDEHMGEE
jgi:hypothetical protein